MSRATIQEAVDEIVAFLAPGGSPVVSGVTRVFGFEPAPGQMPKPVAVTVDDGGMTDLAFVIAVRVYVATDVDAEQAAATIRTVYQEIDELLTTYWGPSDWSRDDDRELGALVATCRLEVGREDGKLRTGGGL